jgi:hypothetical protein
MALRILRASEKQVIGDGLLPAFSSDDKGFSEVLLNHATSFTLSSATSFTLSAAVASFMESAFNSHSKDPLRLKNNSGHEGDRMRSVSRLRRS